jgi:hypothetical protein
MMGDVADSALRPEEAQRLLFRFGFICFSATDSDRIDKNLPVVCRSWPRIHVGKFVIYRHPEARLIHRSQQDRHTILVGDAFVVGEGDPLVLVADAVGDELLDLLDRLSGRFALIIIDGGQGKVFHDPFGARTIFYTCNNTFGIASHSHLLASAFGLKVNTDTPLTRGQSLPGDVTIFPNIYALPPNHCYDIGMQKVVRYWPRKPRQKTTFDEFFSVLDSYLKALVEFVRRSRRPVLSLTGGVDSRTIVSAFRRYCGTEFSTFTSTNFHFEPWEASPVAEVNRYLGVPHIEVDERSDNVVNEAALIAMRNLGRYKTKRAPFIANLWQLYGSSPRAIWVTGVGGEAIRGFYNLKENPMKDLSTEEMARVYVEGGMSDEYAIDRDLEGAVISAFDGFRERAGYDKFDNDTFDVNDIFYWEHRLGMSFGSGLNEIDVALPGLFGFNSRMVCEVAYGLSDDERLSKLLFVEVMRRYDPYIAEVAFWPTSN